MGEKISLQIRFWQTFVLLYMRVVEKAGSYDFGLFVFGLRRGEPKIGRSLAIPRVVMCAYFSPDFVHGQFPLHIS